MEGRAEEGTERATEGHKEGDMESLSEGGTEDRDKQER